MKMFDFDYSTNYGAVSSMASLLTGLIIMPELIGIGDVAFHAREILEHENLDMFQNGGIGFDWACIKAGLKLDSPETPKHEMTQKFKDIMKGVLTAIEFYDE